jgi:hypothetical protein
MKLVAVLASLLLSAPMAFAQNQNVNADDQIIELEQGAISPEAAAALTPPVMQLNRDRGAEIVGGIIGIIGAIAADQIDRDHGGHNGPGHGGPGHGGPGHGGGHNSDVICYARDGRGNVYRAAGPNARRVQERAMDKCERNARFCRPQGCHRL